MSVFLVVVVSALIAVAKESSSYVSLLNIELGGEVDLINSYSNAHMDQTYLLI